MIKEKVQSNNEYSQEKQIIIAPCQQNNKYQENNCQLTKQMIIKLKDLIYIGKGLTHIVFIINNFKNNNKKDLVLIVNFKKLFNLNKLIEEKMTIRQNKNTEKTSQQQKQEKQRIQRVHRIQTLSNQIYQNFIFKFFEKKSLKPSNKIYNQILFHHKTYKIVNQDSQYNLKQFINQQNFFQQKLLLQKQCRISEVKIGQNVSNLNSIQKWNFCIQFKPKTVLPEYYSINMIKQILEQIQLSEQIYPIAQITKTLNQASFQEKQRYFKKNLHDQLSNKKKKALNQSPLKVFNKSITNQTEVPNYLQTKGLKQFEIYKPFSQQLFNKSLHKILHNQSKLCMQSLKYNFYLMNQLFKIQSIYKNSINSIPNPSIFYQSQNYCLLLQKSKDDILSKLLTQFQSLFEDNQNDKHNLAKFIQQQNENYLNKQNVVLNQKDNIKEQQQNIVQMFLKTLKFLISHTWKDISIVIRGKFLLSSQHQIQIPAQQITQQINLKNYDIKIIDWDLKDFKTIEQNKIKQKQLLKTYIKYKLQLNK